MLDYLYFILKWFIWFFVLVSYTVGRIIVAGILLVLQFFPALIGILGALFSVLREDFVIFTSDVLPVIVAIIKTLVNTGEKILHVLTVSLSVVPEVVTLVGGMPYQVIAESITVITWLLSELMILAILIGSGVWFIVKLPYVLVESAYQEIAATATIAARKILLVSQDLRHFATEVPAESMAGLFIAACMVYLLLSFHMIVYRSALKLIARFQIHPKLDETATHSHLSETKTKPTIHDENFCVICLERNKCIVMMPCRHLCMCSECCERFHLYRRSCPICRCYVHQTIQVY